MKFKTEYPSVLNILKPHTYFVSPMWAEVKFFPNLNAADKFEFEVNIEFYMRLHAHMLHLLSFI